MKKSGLSILVEMLHGIGDTVCALPALALLRRNYPKARIDVMVKFSSCRDIVKSSHIDINEIIVLDVYKSLSHDIHVLKRLRNVHYDYMVINCATPVKKAKLFTRLIKPREWFGIQKKGYFLDTVKEDKHFVDLNIEAISLICSSLGSDIYPHLYREVEDYNRILSVCLKNNQYHKNKKTVGICIGNADPSYRYRFFRIGRVYTRGWGIDNITKLLAQLDTLGINILLIGGKQEEPLLAYIRQNLGRHIGVNFVGKTSIKESIAVASVCDLVIGVDTGMQHVAAAVGTKTLSIFGPTDPKTHGPLSRQSYFIQSNTACRNCYGTSKYVSCKDRKCLNTITVNMVIDKVRDILEIR